MFLKGLKCTACGGELELYQGYTGADYKSAAGAEASTDENLSFKQRMETYAQANHRMREEQAV